MTGLNHRSTGLMAAIAAGLTLLTAACQAADSNGVRTVSNPDQLRSALRGAAAGATIALAPGDYGDVDVRKIDRGGPITLVSARHDARATLSGLTIDSSANIIIKDLEIISPPPPPPPPAAVPAGSEDSAEVPAPATAQPARPRAHGAAIKVLNSQHIRLDGVLVHAEAAPDVVGTGTGALIRASSDVTVTNSEFRNLANGLGHLDSDHVTIDRNTFHDIRVDAVRGGGSSNVAITRNAFWSFYRLPRDHPDAIQFWTTNTKQSAHDVTVTGNLIMRGAGGPMQGIFIGDESKGNFPFENVTIADNVVVGSMYHGISLAQSKGAQIRNNIVGGFDDMKSWILVKGGVDAIVEDNEATSYHISEDNTDMKAARNKSISTAKVGDKAALRKWYAAHGRDLPPLPPEALAFIQ